MNAERKNLILPPYFSLGTNTEQNRRLREIEEKFVGREHELDLVQERVDIIRYGGTVFHGIINFHGLTGLGKTRLAQEIHQKMRAFSIPCALIDFTEEKYTDPLFGPVRILENIAASIAERVELQPLEFQQDCSQFWQSHSGKEPDQIEKERDQLTRGFLDYVDRLLRRLERTPLVLCFDATESADQEVLDWLEKEVIDRLIRTDRFVAAITGRRGWRTKEFTVRRRVYQYPLKPFNQEEAKRQLGDYHPLAPLIMEISHGHPGANYLIMKQLCQIARHEDPLVLQQISQHRPALARTMVENLIEQKLLDRISPKAIEAISFLAPLRRFHVETLRYALTDLLPDDFREETDYFFLRILGEMTRTTLVEWASEKMGFDFNHLARQMMVTDMQLNRPEDFLAVHQTALDLYRESITKIISSSPPSPILLALYLNEAFYHLAMIRQVANVSPQEIAGELEARAWIRPKALSREEEKELQASFLRKLAEDEELREILGPHFEGLVASFTA
jgi:hypothetical protein